MTLRKYVALGLLLGAMATCLAACGGSSSTAADAGLSTSPNEAGHPAITKAELIRKGDAICTETDKRQRSALKLYEVGHPAPQIATKSYVEKSMKVVAFPPIATEIEELEALGIPAGDEAQVDAILSGFREALETVEAEPSALIGSGEGPFETPDKLAGKYGFKACAEAL